MKNQRDHQPGPNEVVECAYPQCDAPATVAWGWVDKSSSGVSPGWRMNCAGGHWWTEYGAEIIDPFLDVDITEWDMEITPLYDQDEEPGPFGPGVPD